MNEIKNEKIWNGFKKELPWLLFWIFLLIMSYGYYQDKKICNEVLADPCEACYKLNQSLIDFNYDSNGPIYNYTIDNNSIYQTIKQQPIYYNITINKSIIHDDNNPDDRTIQNYTYNSSYIYTS